MRACGIEINNNEVIVCLLSLSDGVFDVPDCRVRTIQGKKSMNASDMRYFQNTVAKLMEDYKVEKVFIKERPAKGKFAGSAISFKLEAAIELIKTIDVRVLSAVEIKEAVKRHPLPIPFEATELKPFQKTAFMTAYSGLVS